MEGCASLKEEPSFVKQSIRRKIVNKHLDKQNFRTDWKNTSPLHPFLKKT